MSLTEEELVTIAHSIAKVGARYYARFSYDELLGMAWLAILEAQKTFNPDKGLSLSKYLYNAGNWRLRDLVQKDSDYTRRGEQKLRISRLGELPEEYEQFMSSSFHSYSLDEPWILNHFKDRDKDILLLLARGFTQVQLALVFGKSESWAALVVKSLRERIQALLAKKGLPILQHPRAIAQQSASVQTPSRSSP